MPFYEYQCNNCGHALEAGHATRRSAIRSLKKCSALRQAAAAEAHVRTGISASRRWRLVRNGLQVRSGQQAQISPIVPRILPRRRRRRAPRRKRRRRPPRTPKKAKSLPRNRWRKPRPPIRARRPRRAPRKVAPLRTRPACARPSSGHRDQRSSAAARNPRAAGSALRRGNACRGMARLLIAGCRGGLADAGAKP